MLFTETKLEGPFIIEPECMFDERGFFAPGWSEREFADRGLSARLLECSISFNLHQGTLRGMHYQIPPHAQPKLVRCTKGAIYDVALDLRPESKTFREWIATELTDGNHRMFYIPAGFAHGYQTMVDETEVFYQMFEVYAPEFARGVRFDDPAFGIEWPLPPTVMAERDRNYPDYDFKGDAVV